MTSKLPALPLTWVARLGRLGGARRRTVAPWLCGYASEAEPHRYSAHHFYAEIKRYFGWLGGAARPSLPHPPPDPPLH